MRQSHDSRNAVFGGNFGKSRLGSRRRKVASGHCVVKANALVRTVAKWLISGMAAAAQPDRFASRETEGFAFLIDDFKIAFDADRTII